jgi:VIT1/CCC1 family predicted Fe2+/Mn2+ transporter
MMDFELKLEKPKVSRAWISAGTMGSAYFIGMIFLFSDFSPWLTSLGGLIPMIPYFAIKDVTHALFVSIGITVVMLLAFGAVKNWLTIKSKRSAAWGAFQTLCVGVLAAATSYGIVRGLDSANPVDTR